MVDRDIAARGVDDEAVLAAGIPGMAGKVAADQDAISKMYDTPESEAVRARNGWVNIHNSGDEFKVFLEKQEQVIGDLMRKLGFL